MKFSSDDEKLIIRLYSGDIGDHAYTSAKAMLRKVKEEPSLKFSNDYTSTQLSGKIRRMKEKKKLPPLNGHESHIQKVASQELSYFAGPPVKNNAIVEILPKKADVEVKKEAPDLEGMSVKAITPISLRDDEGGECELAMGCYSGVVLKNTIRKVAIQVFPKLRRGTMSVDISAEKDEIILGNSWDMPAEGSINLPKYLAEATGLESIAELAKDAVRGGYKRAASVEYTFVILEGGISRLDVSKDQGYPCNFDEDEDCVYVSYRYTREDDEDEPPRKIMKFK